MIFGPLICSITVRTADKESAPRTAWREDGVPTTLSVGLLSVLLENAFAASRTKAQMNPPVPTPQIAEADP